MTFKNYNLTGFTNYSGDPSVNLMQEVSLQTNYLPGSLIVLVLYVIIFTVLKFKGTSTVSAFAATNFINFIICLLLYALQVIPGWMLVLGIILLPISLAMMFMLEN